jgi:hypothetical protein
LEHPINLAERESFSRTKGKKKIVKEKHCRLNIFLELPRTFAYMIRRG